MTVILCVRLMEIRVWSVCGTTARTLILPVRRTLNGALKVPLSEILALVMARHLPR